MNVFMIEDISCFLLQHDLFSIKFKFLNMHEKIFLGSSAGAGSGEFHVYRHLRRKEYTRQKIIDEMGEKVQSKLSFLLQLIFLMLENLNGFSTVNSNCDDV